MNHNNYKFTNLLCPQAKTTSSQQSWSQQPQQQSCMSVCYAYVCSHTQTDIIGCGAECQEAHMMYSPTPMGSSLQWDSEVLLRRKCDLSSTCVNTVLTHVWHKCCCCDSFCDSELLLWLKCDLQVHVWALLWLYCCVLPYGYDVALHRKKTYLVYLDSFATLLLQCYSIWTCSGIVEISSL